jgi:anaerobic magnesium-protoporphyrin IX monomethyl ester cyclase
MKILLIDPPFMRLKGLRSLHFSLGLGYIGAVLDKAGHEVKHYNVDNCAPDENLLDEAGENTRMLKHHKQYHENLENGDHYIWKEVRDVIDWYKPDLVGITILTTKFGSALNVAQIVKNNSQKTKVIVGGPHVTALTKDVMANDCFDYAVVGEGEKTIVELCAMIAENKDDFSSINGIAFKKDNEVVMTQPRPLIEDINTIPSPLKGNNIFEDRFYPSNVRANIITTRGCPFSCAFCNSKQTWTNRVRSRSLENITAEIEDLYYRFGVRRIDFWDESFTIKKSRVKELCNILLDKNLGLKWSCTTRVDIVDDELVSVMKSAGCDIVHLGIESGSQRILDSINKKINLDKAANAANIFRKHGLAFGAFFMVGFPDETEEDIRATIEFIKKIRATVTCFSTFTPYYGTVLFERTRQLGLISGNIDYSLYSHQSPDNYFAIKIPEKRYKELVAEMASVVDELNASGGDRNQLKKIAVPVLKGILNILPPTTKKKIKTIAKDLISMHRNGNL